MTQLHCLLVLHWQLVLQPSPSAAESLSPCCITQAGGPLIVSEHSPALGWMLHCLHWSEGHVLQYMIRITIHNIMMLFFKLHAFFIYNTRECREIRICIKTLPAIHLLPLLAVLGHSAAAKN